MIYTYIVSITIHMCNIRSKNRGVHRRFHRFFTLYTDTQYCDMIFRNEIIYHKYSKIMEYVEQAACFLFEELRCPSMHVNIMRLAMINIPSTIKFCNLTI